MRQLFFLLLFFYGCGITAYAPPQDPETPSAYNPPRRQSYQSLHFLIQGDSYDKLIGIAGIAEKVYGKIMFDTNLLSFKPKENYLIVIYRTKMDYHLDTGYPLWSGGGTVTKLLGRLLPEDQNKIAKSSIYTFEDAVSPALLAHEISHLIFNEFMDFQTKESADLTRWLNEGLATYEELEGYEESDRIEFLKITESLLKQHALPIERVVRLMPFNEEVRQMGSYFFKEENVSFSNIDLWYWQARSITAFLIEKKGRYNFFLLLNALKQKKDFNAALVEAYSVRWRDLSELETEWRQSLQ